MKEREYAEHKVNTVTAQKTADAVSELAVETVNFKRRLLRRLQRIEEKYPLDATEVRTRQGNSTAIFRIRDLTAAFIDLTDDMPKQEDQSTLEKLDKLLQEAWDAAYR